jgi:hypothetical protein
MASTPLPIPFAKFSPALRIFGHGPADRRRAAPRRTTDRGGQDGEGDGDVRWADSEASALKRSLRNPAVVVNPSSTIWFATTQTLTKRSEAFAAKILCVAQLC